LKLPKPVAIYDMRYQFPYSHPSLSEQNQGALSSLRLYNYTTAYLFISKMDEIQTVIIDVVYKLARIEGTQEAIMILLTLYNRIEDQKFTRLTNDVRNNYL
jgi:hypothetical protein